MSVDMIAVKPLKYKTRRLLPGEHFRVKSDREARVLVHVKRAVFKDNECPRIALDDAREEVGLPPLSQEGFSIGELRQQYFEKVGRRAFNGWTADEILRRMAEAE